MQNYALPVISSAWLVGEFPFQSVRPGKLLPIQRPASLVDDTSFLQPEVNSTGSSIKATRGWGGRDHRIGAYSRW